MLFVKAQAPSVDLWACLGIEQKKNLYKYDVKVEKLKH